MVFWIFPCAGSIGQKTRCFVKSGSAILLWAMSRRLLMGLVVALSGCSANPPPGWASGGAPLVLGPAVWRSEGEVVELRPDGRVFEDGHAVLQLDRSGRVYDDSNEPVAMLLPEGTVVGTDNADFGHVGVANAAPPGGATAWLSVLPDGQILNFGPDGERLSGGKWTGCGGAVQRTCTLVTHLFMLARARSPRSAMYFGVGVGMYR